MSLRVYEVRWADGTIAAKRVRIRNKDGKKRVWWRGPNNEKTLREIGVEVKDLPLYGSELLHENTLGVVVVEGEEAARRLNAIGIPAVGTVTGASGAPGPEALEVLRGIAATLWPDNDGAGHRHMERVAQALRGVASEIFWYEHAGAEHKDDAADALENMGWRELALAINQAPAWEPPPEPGDEMPQSSRSSLRREPGPLTIEGPPIPDGERHVTVMSILGRAHDGTRTLDDLIEIAHRVNRERCSPPIGSSKKDDPLDDLDRLAKWIHGTTPCAPGSGKDPAIGEILQAAGEHWYKELLPRSGKSKTRDVARAHLTLAARHGRLITTTVDGEQRRALRYFASCRELAEEASTSRESSRKGNYRLEDLGAIRKAGKRQGDDAETWLILEPTHYPDTHNNAAPNSPETPHVVTGVNLLRSVRPDELQTPVFGWRSPVGNARGGTLCALEAGGPQTAEELRDWVSPRARLWDFESRHLWELVGLGLIEERDDGTYAVPGDYRERTEQARAEPYAVCKRREREVWDPIREDWEYQPAEYGAYLSDDERDEHRRARHEEERRKYRWAKEREAEIQATVESVGFEELEPAIDNRPETETGELTPRRQVLLDAGWEPAGVSFGIAEWREPVTHEVRREDIAAEIELRRNERVTT